MNFIYIFDDNYAMITSVSIYSLLEKNVAAAQITIYIIDGGIKLDNKKMLFEIGEHFKRNIVFIDSINPDEMYQLTLDNSGWCSTNYIRTYLEYMLPKDIDRAMYIDSDTLIMRDLSDIYNMELDNMPIAACYDAYPLPKYQLGFGIEDEYFSDGILLLDLENLRERNCFQEYKEFLKSREGRVAYLEQGAINCVMKNRIKLMPPEYNVMTLSLIYNKCPTVFFEKNELYYSDAEMYSAIENPAIVHFTGHPLWFRPWYERTNHLYSKQWRIIFDKIEWRKNSAFETVNNRKYVVASCLNILFSIAPFQRVMAKRSKRMKSIEEYRNKLAK